MTSVSRRHFGLLALSAPFVMLLPNSARANLIETLLVRAQVPRHDDELWVLVEDERAVLSVFRGNALVERFAPISLGRAGAKPERLQGGNVTPMGEFRVNRFNNESDWHIFIGLDYPTRPTRAWPLNQGFTPNEITKIISRTIGATAIHRSRPCWVALSVSMA
ncbi:hypothetical protein Q427_30270 [Halomonas sp. BC04]|nr:hypothetical protein Q427_30270 [Halomonas sp. BC04]